MTSGSPLHVERRGTEEPIGGEAFVLVHGFGGTSYTWRHWLPALEKRGHVLLVDLKGFGVSQKPDDGRYRPRDQVELLLRLIDEVDPARVTLIGHSYGGGIALLTALALAERPDPRLHRLVVVAGAAYRQPLPPFVRLAAHPHLTALGLALVGPERVIRTALRAVVADEASVEDAQVRAYARPLRDRAGLRSQLEAARQLVPDDLDELTPRYATIDVPTLLMWGDRDRVVHPSLGRRLADALPFGELAIVEECGHLPQEERPQESVALLEAFLDRSDPEGSHRA